MVDPTPSLEDVLAAIKSEMDAISGLGTVLTSDHTLEDDLEFIETNGLKVGGDMDIWIVEQADTRPLEGGAAGEIYELYDITIRYWSLRTNDPDWSKKARIRAESVRSKLTGNPAVFAIAGQTQLLTPVTVKFESHGKASISGSDGDQMIFRSVLTLTVEARRWGDFDFQNGNPPALTTAAGGDLAGTYPNPTVKGIQGGTLPTAIANGIIIRNSTNTAWLMRAFAHALTHQHGGNDEVATETPAPYAIPKAGSSGKLAGAWIAQGEGSGLDADLLDGAELAALLLRDGTQALTGDLSAGGFRITNSGPPVDPTDLVRLLELDAVSIGLVWKPDAVRFKTQGPLPANAYSNGALGIGATLTGSSNGALTAQDGITPLAGDRCIVDHEATDSHNGVYVVTQVGDGSHPYILTRATDCDTASDLARATLVVSAGTDSGGTAWTQTQTGLTVGTSSILFQKLPSVQSLPGDGLSSVGNTLNVNAGDGLEIVTDFLKVKLADDTLAVGPDGLKLANPKAVEGGRVTRESDLEITAPTDITFTIVKDNENAVFDLGANPKVYTAQTTGMHNITGRVRWKAGTSGTYKSLKMVNLDTSEVIDWDKKVDFASNHDNRTSVVTENVKLTAGQRIKLIADTDSTDDGRFIEFASLSGAYQGAGAAGAGGGGGGVDLAEVLLLKSYFSHNGILPATKVFEEVYDYPTPDYQVLSSGSTLVVSRGTALFTANSGVESIWGWDMGALRSEMLMAFGMLRPRVYATGIFFSDALPISGAPPGNTYLAIYEVSSFRIGLYKVISGTFTLLAAVSGIQPFDNPGAPNMGMALYRNATTHELTVSVRFGSEQWLDAIKFTDSLFGSMRYAGFYESANGGGQKVYTGCPAMLRHE